MFLAYRKLIIAVFVVLALGSGWFVTQLKFSFSFDQFFPQGDDDLEFYKNFISEFESDDNFLLIAVENKPTVFDTAFLRRFHAFSLEARTLPHILKSRSVTQLDFPVKTPFGYATVPAIHLDDPEYFETDRQKLLSDDRIVNNLIDKEATVLVVACKTIDNIDMSQSKQLINALDSLSGIYGFEKVYKLGRPYFQKELVDFQKHEIIQSFLVSVILVMIVMVLLYRKPIGIIIALGSIALGLLLFMGILGLWGRPLNALSALYPVLMLIVGSSDVIHIFSKYTDELRKTSDKNRAMMITIKEIGMATLFTSVTTAIGFATLLTSKLPTVREFGINAAIGVMVAYFTVLLFTTSVLSMFDRYQIIAHRDNKSIWEIVLQYIYIWTARKQKQILWGFGIFVLISVAGMAMISTNYNIENNLPKGAKVTSDFKFFEERLGGFRPLEFAVSVKGNEKADDYAVLSQISKLEEEIKATGVINNVLSISTFYKSLEKVNRSNAKDAYAFPESEEAFYKSKRIIDRIVSDDANILLNQDRSKTRISGRITDIGADSIKALGIRLDRWIESNLDTSLISVRRTGTGLILDKNSEYVTQNLIQGLGLSLLIISFLMGMLFRSFRMLLIALVPNVIPLLFAAGLIGYMGIELEAGISIVFALIFGIAVDDSIHFLGRLKLSLKEGFSLERSIRTTVTETGKAIIFTSIVLFFGFFNMIFSSNPLTLTIGLLISITLVGAVICDLLLLPVLIRKFL
jgi:uncharacterized protein